MDLVRSIPLLSILILFISGFLFIIINKKNTKKLSAISLFLVFILMCVHFIYVYKYGSYTYRVGHFDAPIGITFFISNTEAIIGLLFSVVTLLICFYSYFIIKNEVNIEKQNLYYLLINVLLASLLGIVFTNDLFNAFVFLEISALTSCGIIAVKDSKESIKATLKYLILSSLGSGLVLMGIAFLYPLTGVLDMDMCQQAIMNVGESYNRLILISVCLFTIGLGVKSAMFGLHTWLPDAHSSAPTASSAILSALVIKPPVILLIKIYYRVFGISLIKEIGILDVLLVFGLVGMIAGSIFALNQKEVKRLIAYSSVAQMGYIFYGIGLGNKFGVVISIFHIIGHALTKSTLFLIVGAMIHKTGSKYIKDLKGIGKEMPITLGLFTICSLSMVGIPILPGFVSKWKLSLATIESGKIYLVGVILLSSLLNVAYYFPIIINGYFGEENIRNKVYKSKELKKAKMIPLTILTFLIVLSGIFSLQLINLINIDF